MNHVDEYSKIVPIAAAHGVDPLFILTIREVENGGPGREFGVLSVSAPSWADQCRVACVSVAHRLWQFLQHTNADEQAFGYVIGRLSYTPDFIRFFASIWAPRDVKNDPNNLNANWYPNARDTYAALTSGHDGNA